MRLFQAGDRSVGICEHCKSRVNTRMEYRDYQPTGWSVTVPDVLVGACEQCGNVVGIPHQSTPKINEFRKDKKADRQAIEGRVSREIEAAVELVTASLGGESKSMRPVIFRYYLNLMANDSKVAEAVKLGSEKWIATRKSNRRVSIKMPRHQWEHAWTAAKAVGILNKGQLLRGVAALAADDFQIFTVGGITIIKPKVSKGSRNRRKELKTLAKTII